MRYSTVIYLIYSNTFFQFNVFILNFKFVFIQLKIQREVDFHDNIIRCLGITKSDSGTTNILLLTEILYNLIIISYLLENNVNNYMLVLEYANGGSLRSYLKANFGGLAWDDKYNMACQLACAISCLHNEEIIHRDLVIYLLLF